ncbi:MAG: lysophospholipid transporter LplT [Azoarcus sp.]|jgi:MFS family permease|nr:lysophospholipid transporter LplT [Azoarcus sp.]
MPFGFYIIMAAQFFSALADNALLILAIDILRNVGAPAEHEPLLRSFFSVSYVALAAFVGAFADSMPKWRVMLISNTVKILGCMMLYVGVQPLYAYAMVGLGAAAYSPAKYGILTEYLPHRLLVVANGWIEGLTVGGIIIGFVLGGELIDKNVVAWFVRQEIPLFDNAAHAGIVIIALIYLVAALFNLFIPNTGVDHKPLHNNPLYLAHDFGHCLKLLWRDKLGQISLAVTTLAWGVAAVLQLLVLEWAMPNLGLELSKATRLLGVVAAGMAIGAVLASRFVSLRQSVRVIPLGIAMGGAILLMPLVTNMVAAVVMLLIIGALGGFFVVPMNALLQHRGHVLMGAGHSIAVQNFNENLSILLMNGGYALLIFVGLSINTVVVGFGLFVAIVMYLIKRWHDANQRVVDTVAQLDEVR